MAGDTTGSLVLWGEIDPTKTDEDALNDWWTNEHLPERLALPGFRRARRYRTHHSENGRRNYLAWYEVSSIEDVASPEYMSALNNPTERTKKLMPCLARMNRSACSKTYATVSGDRPIANRLLCIELSVRDQPLTLSSCRQLASSFNHFPALWNFSCFLHNEALTASGSKSSSYDGVQFESVQMDGAESHKHIILVELSQRDNDSSDTSLSIGNLLQEEIAALGAEKIMWQLYELICTMGRL